MLKIALYDHNQSAYDAAVNMMGRTGKAAIIHPTGTGKSFIGFRLCADHPQEPILWLSPSEYIFKTQVENLRAATGGEVPQNITFRTYAKLMMMSEEEIEKICMDTVGKTSSEAAWPERADKEACMRGTPAFIILDEFHRCGAKCWGQGVERLLAVFPDVPILGLSATNIRYLDSQRDMADELFDGNVASEISLGEAIVRGILNPPKYVISVYSWQQDLEKYERRIRQCRNKLVRDECDRYLEELRRTLDMADGLDVIFDKHMADRTGKYLVFCSGKEHMDEMMRHLDWFAKVDRHPHVYSLYSSDPGANRTFDDFRNDHDDTHLRLLYCIDALNEGIHIEDISGVILLRPTVSPIVYKQQIGRALSASKKKTSVIFDIVSNLDSIWSISAIEEEMQLVTAYYRSLGESESIVNERFRIIDEVHDCRELFAKLNDTLTASWDLMFEQAKVFYQKYGNLEVPARYITENGCALGNWIFNQKAIRKGQLPGTLTEERIRRLDSIGMVWESATDLVWEKNYAAAKRYWEKHGDLNVPSKYVDEKGIALGSWLADIRAWENANARQMYLTPDRVQKLNDLGMVWDVADYYWERNYAAASGYYQEHGNLEVPLRYVTEDGICLGSWIYRLRSLRAGTAKGTPPTEEQVRRLEAIGMTWMRQSDHKWEKGFQAAADYAKEHGSLMVPVKYTAKSSKQSAAMDRPDESAENGAEEGFPLGTWIQRQRSLYKNGKLNEERRERLEAIGMSWQADTWEARLALAKAWYQEHGTVDIPQDTVVDGVWIGKWIAMQKKYLEAGKLTPEQERKLSELPLEQVSQKDKAWKAWLRMYQDAAAYAEEYGSLQNIPRDYRGNSGNLLNAWVSRQRLARKNGRLSDEQQRMLDALGFVWGAGIEANPRREPAGSQTAHSDRSQGTGQAISRETNQEKNRIRNTDRSRNRDHARTRTIKTGKGYTVFKPSLQEVEAG